MKNRGIDFSIGHRAAAGSVNFNGSHYRNKIVSDRWRSGLLLRSDLDALRQSGHQQGWRADRFVLWPDRRRLLQGCGRRGGHATQDGAAPGRIKFSDVNGDGQVTLADRTIIGSPHPDFTAGLDLGLRTRQLGPERHVLRDVRQRHLRRAKGILRLPRISPRTSGTTCCPIRGRRRTRTRSIRGWTSNDNYSHAISSFYVEDGSYVRLRNLQLGYNVPARFARWLNATQSLSCRPRTCSPLPATTVSIQRCPPRTSPDAAGDIRDQYRGIDRGTYPSNRTFSFGMITIVLTTPIFLEEGDAMKMTSRHPLVFGAVLLTARQAGYTGARIS